MKEIPYKKSLEYCNPKLAAEWHPTKNGNLKPNHVCSKSNIKAWWYLPYDDPKTGKHFDFEWETRITNRVINKNGCPFLSGRAVWPGFNDLETLYPELAEQWHPTKNGNLKPNHVCSKSNIKAWWYLPYDDPKTGKHFDFEWETIITNRVINKNGCPFLSGNAVWPGFNDLKTLYPELAEQWHPTKNGNLKPNHVFLKSHIKAWWHLPFDDPKTGKHFDFEWETRITNRVINKNGCPFLSGQAVWPGFNDLETLYPELAEQWHPTKNGNLKPNHVCSKSNIKAWWYLPYDDPKTGKHFDFEWESQICGRVINKSGCPFLSGQAVWPGFNDLETLYPELAEQWHPIKNNKKASEVYYCSKKKVWWYLPYDDPKTGKHFDFEWETRICGRVSKNLGCPFLSGRAVWPGFNDLETLYPELAEQWHPTKNGNLKPNHVFLKSHIKAWWHLPYDDPKTGKHFDFEWETRIYGRVSKNLGCPFLSGQAVWPGFNDLETLYPELAEQWHPTKNGNLKPNHVCSKSNIKAWWYLPYDDPKTGKHFDFEWETRICDRVSKNLGCPFLSGNAVRPGFNDLETLYPKLAKQWHPIKNNKKASEVYYCSKKKVWWYLPYDDPKTGKHFDFEWETRICGRVSKNLGCPFLSGRAVWPGFNDLETLYPELVEQWHPTKNGNLKPNHVCSKSRIRVWWYLPYDDPKTGKHFDFEWETRIYGRVSKNLGCPFLSGQAVWPGFNDLETLYPELAEQWHPTKNGNLKPNHVCSKSNIKAWWYLPYDDPKTGKHFDFEWETRITNRVINKNGCPFLSGNAVWPGFNDLETLYPELAEQWHPTKNNKKASEVYYCSQKKVWWYLPYDDPKTGKHFDFEWKTSVASRTTKGSKCPILSGYEVWKGFNDLETLFPEIANEWHESKNFKKTPSMFTVFSGKKVWWRCENGHEWRAIIVSRTGNGTMCPYCAKRK